MKNTLSLTVAAVSFLAALNSDAALNILKDPGFEGGETGTLVMSSSPWYDPNPGAGNVAVNSSNPHSGSFNATETSTLSGTALLFQNVTLTPNVPYTINFWAAAPGAGGTLRVILNGKTAGTLTLASSSSYADYNFTVTPTSASGIFEFTWASSSTGTVDIDQASVAVPEPTTMVAGVLMLLPFAASTFRLRKKTS